MMIRLKLVISYLIIKDYEQLTSLRVGGSDIIPSNCIINLGSFFMPTGDVPAHINHVCKTSFFALYRIDKLRTLLDNACIEKLVHAFICSRLDYCNSISYGCPSYEIQNCNLYKMPLLELLPIVRNMIILLPFVRNYTGSLLKKLLFLKIYI